MPESKAEYVDGRIWLWRQKAHEAMSQYAVRKAGRPTVSNITKGDMDNAYVWASGILGVEKEEFWLAHLTEDQCKTLIAAYRDWRNGGTVERWNGVGGDSGPRG